MNELVDVNFDDLKEGDEVEFEIADGEKGPNAVQVKRV
jgi:cold shock CspA family protein